MGNPSDGPDLSVPKCLSPSVSSPPQSAVKHRPSAHSFSSASLSAIITLSGGEDAIFAKIISVVRSP